MKHSTFCGYPRLKSLVTVIFVSTLLIGSSFAAKAGGEINTGYFGNVAIQGYDPVGYFTEGKAMKGSEAHTHKWLGAEWRFANEKHRELFSKSPQSFAPQYGGHCATGLAIHGGLTKDIDPEAWTIIDNKLYFNYSKDTQELLTENVISLDEATANWKKAEQKTH